MMNLTGGDEIFPQLQNEGIPILGIPDDKIKTALIEIGNNREFNKLAQGLLFPENPNTVEQTLAAYFEFLVNHTLLQQGIFNESNLGPDAGILDPELYGGGRSPVKKNKYSYSRAQTGNVRIWNYRGGGHKAEVDGLYFKDETVYIIETKLTNKPKTLDKVMRKFKGTGMQNFFGIRRNLVKVLVSPHDGVLESRSEAIKDEHGFIHLTMSADYQEVRDMGMAFIGRFGPWFRAKFYFDESTHLIMLY